jgi:hypothetical protein
MPYEPAFAPVILIIPEPMLNRTREPRARILKESRQIHVSEVVVKGGRADESVLRINLRKKRSRIIYIDLVCI